MSDFVLGVAGEGGCGWWETVLQLWKVSELCECCRPLRGFVLGLWRAMGVGLGSKADWDLIRTLNTYKKHMIFL